MKKTFKSSLFAGLLAAAALAPAAQAADHYPNRPIRVVIMFPAGGSADIVSRLVTQKVGEMSGFNFVVENRPGAGGNLALDAVATAPADGYRSEEHTSELKSLMRISYAVFCLKKKKNRTR